MKAAITAVNALEILDSRGNPTVRVFVTLADGTQVSASVPSGASTGANEAVELRDGDKARYGGKGVLKAVANVNDVIAPKLIGIDPARQAKIDALMIELDGTPNKAKLGANAILGVSMAVARAAAQSAGLPLYAYLGGAGATRLPVPMMNVLNGGKHADNSVDFQEFMLMPDRRPKLRRGTALRLRDLPCAGENPANRATPPPSATKAASRRTSSNEEACELIVEAIEAAGYKPGKDVAIALDPAASSFFTDGAYDLASRAGRKTSDEMIDLFDRWLDAYPIVSLEDGLDESDWAGFTRQTARQGSRVQIVGDDLFVTNSKFIHRGIAEKAANAVLIKLNQIGSVTETIQAIATTRDAGWRYVISHRSGETEDSFMADFAVAMGGGQIKTGSASRSERIAKYNRLLEIEAELGSAAEFVSSLAARG